MRSFPFLLALGCASPLPLAPAGPPPVELRAYDLPPGHAGRLVGSLQRVLDPAGRAQEGPGGSLVVVAPADVLDGVDVVVRRAIEGPAAPAPRNVEVEYWVVRGVRAAEGSRGPELDAVGGTLDAIQSTDGPMALSLVTRRRLRTLDGDRGEIEDDALRISQTVGVEPGGDTIVADTRLEVPYVQGQPHPAAKVQTRIAMRSGAVAVLSQTGFPSDQGTSSLYLLVRPTLVE
jgi:hypothetical protein